MAQITDAFMTRACVEIQTAFPELQLSVLVNWDAEASLTVAVLRSKSPALVLQEIWGHLCCHYAIRSLMTDAATHVRPRPRPSQLRRRTADHPPIPRPPGRFPPDGHAADRLWQGFLTRLLRRLNPARRLRAAPRVVKRKMPKWHGKRALHADWPQPKHQSGYTVLHPN